MPNSVRQSPAMLRFKFAIFNSFSVLSTETRGGFPFYTGRESTDRVNNNPVSAGNLPSPSNRSSFFFCQAKPCQGSVNRFQILGQNFPAHLLPQVYVQHWTLDVMKKPAHTVKKKFPKIPTEKVFSQRFFLNINPSCF
jgi:hypothetical protein